MIKKGDFIEVEYTGKLTDGTVFDTSDEKVAKEKGLFNPKMEYGPIIICVGQKHLVKGLDDELEGKELGTYTIELSAENAFGKKNAKLIQLIPTTKFKANDINPMPGLQINIDGALGVVKNVSGGRTLVDFNHPLSGQDVVYNVKVNKIVEDDKEKVNAMIKLQFNVHDAQIEIKEGTATIKTDKIPKEMEEALNKQLSELIPNIKKVTIQSLKP